MSLPSGTQSLFPTVGSVNPTLTPAFNQTKIGAWTRLNCIAVYRVCPEAIYGRKTV